jgi:hypothetical protein
MFGITLTLALVFLGLCLAARRGLARIYERHPLAACVLLMAGAPTLDANQQFQTANEEHRVEVGTFDVGTTNTGVRSQRFVTRDGSDTEVTVTSTGDVALGYLEYGSKDASANPTFGPGEIKKDEDFATGDSVKITRGYGYMVPVTLEGGTSAVTASDPLTTGASGKLKAAGDLAVSVPAGTTTVQSTAAQPDLTESGAIPPEPVQAYAMESGDPSGGADAEIFAMLAI